MDDLDLKPIVARAEAATRGPWTVGVRWEEPYGTYWLPVNSPSTNEEEPHQPDRVALIRYYPGGFQFPHADAQADAEFIAAARGDVQDLVSEVERLRVQLDEVKGLHTDSIIGPCPSCYRPGDVSDIDDGLVWWPCPTLRALGKEPATVNLFQVLGGSDG